MPPALTLNKSSFCPHSVFCVIHRIKNDYFSKSINLRVFIRKIWYVSCAVGTKFVILCRLISGLKTEVETKGGEVHQLYEPGNGIFL
jgi:hypothetical protein